MGSFVICRQARKANKRPRTSSFRHINDDGGAVHDDERLKISSPGNVVKRRLLRWPEEGDDRGDEEDEEREKSGECGGDGQPTSMF